MNCRVINNDIIRKHNIIHILPDYNDINYNPVVGTKEQFLETYGLLDSTIDVELGDIGEYRICFHTRLSI